MGRFRDRLAGAIAGKDSAAGPLTVAALVGANDPVWMRVDPRTLIREGYKRNAWVYACITGISRTAKGIPWTAMVPEASGGARAMRDIERHYGLEARQRLDYYRRNGQLTESEDHPILKLLARPNPEMGGGQLTEAVVSNWLIAGSSYLEAVLDAKGVPVELWPQMPHRIRIIPNAQGRIQAYRYSITGTSYLDFSPEQMLQHKFYNPDDDWYGMSPLEAAARAVDRDNMGEQWNMALLQNGGRLTGAFIAKQTLDPQSRTELKSELKQKVEGPKNAGRVLLLDGDVSWQEMGVSPKDMDWTQGEKSALKRICAAFGWPMPLVDPEASATYANYEEARKASYEDCVLPLEDHRRDDLNGWLAPKYPNPVLLAYKTDEIEALQEDRASAWTRTNDPRMMVNERREAVGLKPIDGGDVFLIPATTQIIPEDELGTPPPPPAQLPAEPEAVPADPDGDGDVTKPKSRRAFNLKGEQRADYWRGWEAARSAWEQQLRRRFEARFAAEGEYVAKAVGEATDSAGMMRVVHHIPQAQWERLYTASLSAVAQDFGERTLNGLDTRDDSTPSWWNQGAAEWVRQVALTRVGEVNATTRKMLQTVITKGLEDGLSIQKIADEIRSLFKTMSPIRAERIARTETIGASNAGAMFAARSTGLPLKKEWLATMDTRTRETHAEADGQTRGMDEPFSVGGYQMEQPGDPTAPPSEVINCRCTVVFQVQR